MRLGLLEFEYEHCDHHWLGGETSPQETMSKTRELTIREMVRQRRSLYYSDVLAGISAGLHPRSYSVVAVACAERLLTRHLGLPENMRLPFTATLRHPMDCIWEILADTANAARLRVEVTDTLQRFYNSPLNQKHLSDGQYWPGEAKWNAAAACIYAAESIVQHFSYAEGLAVSRLVDDAFARAAVGRKLSSRESGKMSEVVERCCHPIVQHELQWIQQLVNYIESLYIDVYPLTNENVSEIRSRASA